MEYSIEKTGTIIAELRKSRGWTQKQLGKEIGYTGKQIHNYESAYTMPPIDILFKLCKVFECELGYLLGEADYSEGTRIETVIHEKIGLTKGAMDTIRLLTGTGKKSPRFGYESEGFRSLLNRVLTSEQFLPFMDELLNLEESFQKRKSIDSDLINQIGGERLNAAIELRLETEGLPDEKTHDATQQEIADMTLFEDARDDMRALDYSLKVQRYEVREAFEILLGDLFPRRAGE